MSESAMRVSSFGPVSMADAVVSSRVGDAAVPELAMRVSSGPMGVVPAKPAGLFLLPVICAGYVSTPRPVSAGEPAVAVASPSVTSGERGTVSTAAADVAVAVAPSVA